MQARWASGRLDGPAGGPGSTKVCGVSTSAQFGSMLHVCVYIYMCVCMCIGYILGYSVVYSCYLQIYVGEFGFIATNPKTIYIYRFILYTLNDQTLEICRVCSETPCLDNI